MVAAFFLDISQFSFALSLSDTYPSKHDCLLPRTWWVVGLEASTLLAKVVSLLRRRYLFIMTWPLPWPNIHLPSFVLVCPRTITSHTYVISSRVSVFSLAKEHTPDASTSGTPQHLLHVAPCPPRSTMWWRSYDGDFLWGFERELSYLLFPVLYKLLKDSGCSTFWIFNSQESIRRALPYFRKLPLAVFLVSRTFSPSTS